jgi:ankyrin repeat protein
MLYVMECNPYANVNQKREGGYTPLYIASRRGHWRVVDMLLSHKADINITDDTLLQAM